jgi:hypothetical protein
LDRVADIALARNRDASNHSAVDHRVVVEGIGAEGAVSVAADRYSRAIVGWCPATDNAHRSNSPQPSGSAGTTPSRAFRDQ